MAMPRCRHGRYVCGVAGCMVADDSAKRAFEIIRNMVHHVSYEDRIHNHLYVALRLVDGDSDGHGYDTFAACVKAQRGDRSHYAYFSFRNAPNGFESPHAAMIFLAYHRMAYDQGHRTPDPDEIERRQGGSLAMPIAGEHIQNHLSRLAEGVSMDTLLRVIGRKK